MTDGELTRPLGDTHPGKRPLRERPLASRTFRPAREPQTRGQMRGQPAGEGAQGVLQPHRFAVSPGDVLTQPTAGRLATGGFMPAGEENGGSRDGHVHSQVTDGS